MFLKLNPNATLYDLEDALIEKAESLKHVHLQYVKVRLACIGYDLCLLTHSSAVWPSHGAAWCTTG